MAKKIPIEKQKAFIEQFEKVRSDYVEYAELLEKILTKAVDQMASLALVQTRAKTVSSFSNKIISKDKYRNPLTDMTDLCGARVIVHFKSHADKICAFIRDHFEIDETNSLDTKSRLGVSEFGYKSIHYIVTPKQDSILGVSVAEKFRHMKAEIQVRTLAEHVWADISHDRLYKTTLRIPDKWRRDAARLSAILEDADDDFSKWAHEIDSLARVYAMQLEREKADVEVETLTTLISVQEANVDECVKNAIKLAIIYQAMDRYQEAESLLETWLDRSKNPLINAGLWFEYGMVQCLQRCGEPDSSGYFKGMKAVDHSLRLCGELPEGLLKENEEKLSYWYYRVGRLLMQHDGKSDEALGYIGTAHRMMPENPLYFVAMLECVVQRNIDLSQFSINLFKPGLADAIDKLESLLEIGIEKVPGWFAIAHCHFFLGNETACICAYARAIESWLDEKYLTGLSILTSEMALAGRLTTFDPALAGQIQLFLNIAMVRSSRCSDKIRYQQSLHHAKIRKEPFRAPVVIVAGGASLMDQDKVKEYREYVRELMHGFRGTIISGGTTAGIPGLVGQVKTDLEKQTKPAFDLIAWLPRTLPPGAKKSPAYDAVYETASDQFSALDILSCWADLITSGIDPSDVFLLGIEGGDIATMEYAIALALGAKVGLMEYSGRAVSRFLDDHASTPKANLLVIPHDPQTVWALVNHKTKTSLTTDEIEILASQVHAFYLEKKMEELDPKTGDVNTYKVIMPWKKLDPALQHSNFKQVEFYELILQRAGLGIRKSEKPVPFNIKQNLPQETYDLLASLEHARWNAERLLEGWRFGQDKDLVKKTNPCLIPWTSLGPETRRWDYDPVDNIPEFLAKIGYEVYKMS